MDRKAPVARAGRKHGINSQKAKNPCLDKPFKTDYGFKGFILALFLLNKILLVRYPRQSRGLVL
jgi:hypothetical protein